MAASAPPAIDTEEALLAEGSQEASDKVAHGPIEDAEGGEGSTFMTLDETPDVDRTSSKDMNAPYSTSSNVVPIPAQESDTEGQCEADGVSEPPAHDAGSSAESQAESQYLPVTAATLSASGLDQGNASSSTGALPMRLGDASSSERFAPPLQMVQKVDDPEELEWRRSYNINLRQEEWRRRQDKLIAQKIAAWNLAAMERETRVAAAKEAAAQKHLEDRLKEENRRVELEFLDKCREVQIQKRNHDWEAGIARRIAQEKREREEKLEMQKQEVARKKQEYVSAAQEEARQRAEEKKRLQKVAQVRQSHIEDMSNKREQQGSSRVKALKDDKAEALMRKAAKAAQMKPSTRCVLLLPPEEPKTQDDMERDVARELALARKEQQRNARELQRANALKEREAATGLLTKFSGTVEQALLRKERSIFQ